ncbi:MAG: NYN domain-containing protein, partial [Anaerolineae bacterium]|nr:NYN domain-containing protein [Anaerolineae bacterium]
MQDNRKDVAVFIDFENIYISVHNNYDADPNFEYVMDKCAEYGRITSSKAYADWYRYPRVTSALYAHGIEPMYVPTYYYERDKSHSVSTIKNSV